MNKFSPIFDLGWIEFPDWLTCVWFEKLKSLPNTIHISSDLIPENFPIIANGVVPGDKIQILVFEQLRDGATTFEEREEFLKSRELFSLGTCGLISVLTHRLECFPREHILYTSPDKKENLYGDVAGHKVPRFCIHTNNQIVIDTGYLNFGFDRRQRFFGFRKI